MRKWLILLVSVLSLSLIFAGCGAKTPTYNYDLSKYLTLGQYKGIEVSTDEIETALQEQIDSLLSNNSKEEEVTDRAVKNGDKVNIDFTGTLDGEVFEGGTASAADLTIGSNTYIEGFEEGLIGKNIDETVVLDLKFPDEYTPNPDMAGKDVQFEVTINSIKETIVPEYTDEFIAGLGNEEYTTIEAYETDLRKNIKENLIWNTLMDSTNVIEHPKKETKFYYDKMIEQYENMALTQYGTSLEKFILSMGSDYDSFLNSTLEVAKNQIKKDMVTYAIARAENIKAEGNDYDEIALIYAENSGFETVKAYADAYGKAEVDRSVILHRVVEMLANESVEI